MTRALISGITGHVGQELACQLLAAGVEVHGITRGVAQPDVHLHQVDGRTESLIALFEAIRPDIVFHLAALARREHKTTDVEPFINANLLLGAQLLEASKAVGCRRFVSAGSYLQHGDSGEFRPFNLYAATKNAFEDVLTFYAEAFGFAAVVLTLCNVYGERDPRPTLITDIASALVRGTPLHLHAEESWVDLVHVEDVAAAFVRAMLLFERNELESGTFTRFSVSSGKAMTSTELVKVFERVGHRSVTVKRGEQSHPPRRGRPWRGNPVPGWEQRVTLDDGVARILQKARAT